MFSAVLDLLELCCPLARAEAIESQGPDVAIGMGRRNGVWMLRFHRQLAALLLYADDTNR
jgi:hypothetical protein